MYAHNHVKTLSELTQLEQLIHDFKRKLSNATTDDIDYYLDEVIKHVKYIDNIKFDEYACETDAQFNEVA